MEKVNVQDKFFVCYASDMEELAKSVIAEINSTLETNYVLWERHTVGDVDVFYEKVVEPAIEQADFVLFMLSKNIEADELANQVQTYCHNINKSIIPLKIEIGKLKLRKFEFRANVIDFNENQEKMAFMEQMHSWLGLTKVYEWSEVKFCSNCGKKINTLSTFCKWCGTHFDEQALKRCAKCGNPLKPDVLFCNRCGNKIS